MDNPQLVKIDAGAPFTVHRFTLAAPDWCDNNGMKIGVRTLAVCTS